MRKYIENAKKLIDLKLPCQKLDLWLQMSPQLLPLPSFVFNIPVAIWQRVCVRMWVRVRVSWMRVRV